MPGALYEGLQLQLSKNDFREQKMCKMNTVRFNIEALALAEVGVEVSVAKQNRPLQSFSTREALK
jgi:hypothetical protein